MMDDIFSAVIREASGTKQIISFPLLVCLWALVFGFYFFPRRYWNMMDETYLVNQIKEQCCFVSEHFKEDIETVR
jgi:hypothetical protein